MDWVFGYGSLVSPTSLGRTLERTPEIGVDMIPAALSGYGRRWNYGISPTQGRSADGRLWTLVALGLIVAPAERVNGVVASVSADELLRLDAREAEYDRVEVTYQVTTTAMPGSRRPFTDHLPPGARVYTYVPRPVASARAREAAAAESAAIEQRYWDLVLEAFTAIGERERYLATTPPAGIPVLDLERI